MSKKKKRNKKTPIVIPEPPKMPDGYRAIPLGDGGYMCVRDHKIWDWIASLPPIESNRTYSLVEKPSTE